MSTRVVLLAAVLITAAVAAAWRGAFPQAEVSVAAPIEAAQSHTPDLFDWSDSDCAVPAPVWPSLNAAAPGRVFDPHIETASIAHGWSDAPLLIESEWFRAPPERPPPSRGGGAWMARSPPVGGRWG